MDLKKRIEEITQNGTLESGEKITYVDTDDLYLLLNEVSSSEVIHDVSVPLPTVEDYKFWYAPKAVKNLDGTLTDEDWIGEEDQNNFDLFRHFINEWAVHCNER